MGRELGRKWILQDLQGTKYLWSGFHGFNCGCCSYHYSVASLPSCELVPMCLYRTWSAIYFFNFMKLALLLFVIVNLWWSKLATQFVNNSFLTLFMNKELLFIGLYVILCRERIFFSRTHSNLECTLPYLSCNLVMELLFYHFTLFIHVIHFFRYIILSISNGALTMS